MLIDLSYPIHTGMGVYPNDPSVTISDASATVPATTAEPYSRKGFYLGSCDWA